MVERAATRVLFVDDNSGLLEGLRVRFDLEGDLECAGTLPSAARLVQEAGRLLPDVVLLDIEMPGPDPFDVATDLNRIHPEIRTVFLSAYVRDEYISSAVQAGAWGYLSKSDDVDDLIASIRRGADGEFAFSPKVRARTGHLH